MYITTLVRRCGTAQAASCMLALAFDEICRSLVVLCFYWLYRLGSWYDWWCCLSLFRVCWLMPHAAFVSEFCFCCWTWITVLDRTGVH